MVVGGRAFSAKRACAVGADAWATDVAGARPFLDSWTAARPALAQPGPTSWELVELEQPSAGLIDDCMFELLDRAPQLGEMRETQPLRTREDIGYILQSCSAALLTEDQTLMDEFTTWLCELLASRHVPSSAIRVSYEAISTVLGGGFPCAVATLTAAQEWL